MGQNDSERIYGHNTEILNVTNHLNINNVIFVGMLTVEFADLLSIVLRPLIYSVPTAVWWYSDKTSALLMPKVEEAMWRNSGTSPSISAVLQSDHLHVEIVLPDEEPVLLGYSWVCTRSDDNFVDLFVVTFLLQGKNCLTYFVVWWL